jgi:carboxymethylenebutenolidase
MAHEQILIGTGDGECPTHVFTPSKGQAPWPAVIFYMDGLGIRPTLFEMGQTLADAGYVVLLPDLYYRAGPYAPLDPKAVFAAGSPREALGHLFGSTDNRRVAADSAAYIAYVDSRPDVKRGKIGVTGYCMGGGMALTVAATYPDRVGAAASFHGGNLATDEETSPHRLVSKIKARVYVAGADNDRSYPPEMAERLERALTDSGVDHRCEIFEGALHGWTMADFPVYSEADADRHWRKLINLFKETIG